MKRHDPNKTKVKKELFDRYGSICMICGQTFKKDLLELHHLEKWHDTHLTTFEHSGLVCSHCHHNINFQELNNTEEYIRLNLKIRNYKATH